MEMMSFPLDLAEVGYYPNIGVENGYFYSGEHNNPIVINWNAYSNDQKNTPTRLLIENQPKIHYLKVRMKKRFSLTSKKLIILLSRRIPKEIEEKLTANGKLPAIGRCIELGFNTNNPFHMCALYKKFAKIVRFEKEETDDEEFDDGE